MSSDWQHQLDKISDRAKHILKTGLWSDCQFIVGIGENKKEFKAHRLILSMASPVFDKMFHGGMQENNIEVVDIQPEAFAAMLTYVYTDEIQMQSFDQACELCYIANKYMMPILVQHCIAYIWKDVNFSNACRAYEFAKLFDQHDVMEDCKQIILKQTSLVIDHASFREIEKETLSMILEEDQLSIKSEKQLYEAVEIWLEAEFQRKGIVEETEKKSLIDEIVPKIRFLSMSPQEFAEGPAISPFIAKDDSFALLLNITSCNAPIAFPDRFSNKLRTVTSCELDVTMHEELTWDLHNLYEFEVKPDTDYALSISCDKDVRIHSVKVMGHVLSDDIYDSPYSSSEEDSRNCITFTPAYNQGIQAYVDDQKTTMCQHTVTKSSSGFIEDINIIFPRPFRMKQRKIYRLGVKVFKSGWFIVGNLRKATIDHKSFMFQLINLNSDKSIIKGITFSC